MRHLKWIILAVAVVVLVVLGTLFLPGRLWIPPLTSEQLLMLEPDAGSPHSIPDDGMMLVDFGKTPGAPSLAGIFIYAEPIGSYAYDLRTTLQHDESYRIESMRLTFRIPLDTGGKLALATPEGGPWNDPVFARDPADGSISFSVDHLGFLGTGSVGNEFVFQQFAQESGDEAAFSLHATFTLRSNGLLRLKEHVVDADIDISLPVQSTADGSTSVDGATAQAETTLREFFQAWAAKDLAAYAALLTESRRQDMNLGDWTFAGHDRVKFGPVTAAPEVIDRHMATYGHPYRGDIAKDDVRCFRASITWYYNPGVIGPNDSGEELPWMWWLVRDADGKWGVDGWGA